MDDVYFSYEDDADFELHRKWVYYAPVYRLDEMHGHIVAHCKDAVSDTWKVDLAAFRSGMSMEAAYIASVAAWASVMVIRIDPNVPRIYQMVLSASRGELSLDQVLSKLEDELWDCEHKMDITSAEDREELSWKSKDLKKVIKEPSRWWLSLAPGTADSSEASRQYVDYAQALEYARHNPDFVKKPVDISEPGASEILAEAAEILKALEISQSAQLQRIKMMQSNDEKELVKLFRAAYPNAPVGDGPEGARRAGRAE